MYQCSIFAPSGRTRLRTGTYGHTQVTTRRMQPNGGWRGAPQSVIKHITRNQVKSSRALGEPTRLCVSLLLFHPLLYEMNIIVIGHMHQRYEQICSFHIKGAGNMMTSMGLGFRENHLIYFREGFFSSNFKYTVPSKILQVRCTRS